MIPKLNDSDILTKEGDCITIPEKTYNGRFLILYRGDKYWFECIINKKAYYRRATEKIK